MTTAEQITVVSVTVTTVLTLVNIGIALWAQWINHKNRTSHYDHLVYGKQVEACCEIYGCLQKLHEASMEATHPTFPTSFESTNLQKKVEQVGGLLTATLESMHKWAICLPEEVNERMADYIEAHHRLRYHLLGFPPVDGEPPTPPKNPRQSLRQGYGHILNKAFYDVIKAARKCVGTKPISERVAKILGIGPDTSPTTPAEPVHQEANGD